MELKEKYAELESKMLTGKNVDNMKLFGKVMTMMMNDLIEREPEKAAEYIAQLEAVKWKNYLTEKEGAKIVSMMEPAAPWSKEQWRKAMSDCGCSKEEWPYYNEEALYVTMCMVMSDSGVTIAKYVNSSNMLMFVHDVAVDKLKDKDGVFSVRKYFGNL